MPALHPGPARPLCSPSHPTPCRLKASEAPELEEDEGFGDWAQKSELRQPLQGESPEGEQEEARQVGVNAGREASGRALQAPRHMPEPEPSAPLPSQPPEKAPRLGGGKGEREEENETARRRRGAAGAVRKSHSWLPRALGPIQTSCGRRCCHISTHLQPTYVMEALAPAPPLPPAGLAGLHSHGGEQVFPDVRAREAAWGTSFPDVQTCLPV